MAQIGSFGDVIFEVTEKKVHTFKNMERKGSARWNDHEVIQHKPRSEFVGPGLEEISFAILLKADLGVNPAKQLELLRDMRDTGKVAFLVIGEKPVSQNPWSIQQITESYKIVDNKGNILSAEVNISLKEHHTSKAI